MENIIELAGKFKFQGAQRRRGQRGGRLRRARGVGVPATLVRGDRGRVLVGKRPGMSLFVAHYVSFENLFVIWLFQSRNVVAEEQKSISVVSHRGEAGPIRIFNRYYSLVQFRTLVPVMFIEVHLSL